MEEIIVHLYDVIDSILQCSIRENTLFFVCKNNLSLNVHYLYSCRHLKSFNLQWNNSILLSAWEKNRKKEQGLSEFLIHCYYIPSFMWIKEWYRIREWIWRNRLIDEWQGRILMLEYKSKILLLRSTSHNENQRLLPGKFEENRPFCTNKQEGETVDSSHWNISGSSRKHLNFIEKNRLLNLYPKRRITCNRPQVTELNDNVFIQCPEQLSFNYWFETHRAHLRCRWNISYLNKKAKYFFEHVRKFHNLKRVVGVLVLHFIQFTTFLLLK